MVPPNIQRFIFIFYCCLAPVFLRAERDVFRAETIYGAGGNEKSPGTFSPPSPLFSYFCLNKRIETADFDGDGFRDFAVVSDGTMPDRAYSGILGIGNLAAGDFFYNKYPALGGDSVPDPSPNVQVGQQADPWGKISLFNKTGDLAIFENLSSAMQREGHFKINYVSPCNIYAAQEMAVASLDTIGPPDIVVWTGLGGYAPGLPPATFAPPRSNRSSVVIYRNASAPGIINFSEINLVQRDTHGGPGTECDRPEAGTLADVNKDGFLDIVVACYDPAVGQNSLFWYLNNFLNFDWNPADGVIDAPFPISVAGAPVTDSNIRKVASADIDGDGGTDIIFGSDSGASQLICLHDNGVDFERRQLANAFPVRAIAVGSLAGNAKLDVVAGGGGPASPLTLFIPNNNVMDPWTTVQLPGGNLLTTEIGEAKLADVNQDGLLDIIAVAGQNSASPAAQAQGWDSHVMVWIQLADVDGTPGPEDWQPMGLWEPNFGQENTPPTFSGPAWGGVAIGDFDGDLDNDIVRVTKHWPIVYFENTWNTIQKVQVRITSAEGERGSAVFHSTSPAGSFWQKKGMDWGN